MRENNAERIDRSSEETKQDAPDKRVERPSMPRETSSRSRPSTIASDGKSSSSRTLVSPSQPVSGRDAETGSSNSRSFSYSTQKWLGQTPQEEPWNAAGCSRDFYCMDNTDGASNPTTRSGRSGDGHKDSNGGK